MALATDKLVDWTSAFRKGFPQELPPNWENDHAIVAAHRQLANEAIQAIPAYDKTCRGKGVVICAGGKRLFTNAWVCIRRLRATGCSLPIEVWYLGEHELDAEMRRLLRRHNVTCIDAEQYSQLFSARILNGWELKAYAILHSAFQEVLMLDADNVAVLDPTFLFEAEEYKMHGAIFWPDYGRLEPFRRIWDACEVEYRDEPEFETGQIVVDKQRCWDALQLAWHYNEHSDFYYRHIHGDKDTFHMAFHRMRKSYAMPAYGIHSLDATMCQHDFQGNRLFQHRNMDKWSLEGSNRSIGDFWYEDECREHLAELRSVWSGEILWNEELNSIERRLLNRIASNTYRYCRVGYDERDIVLSPDRSFAVGGERNERRWTVLECAGAYSIVFHGEDGPTCRLEYSQNSWRGRWFRHERMPITLSLRSNGDA